MSKSIRWKWAKGFPSRKLRPESESRSVATSHWSQATKSELELLAAAPLMMDALLECLTVFGDNFLNSFDMHASDEGAVTIQEAINAIETIQALRDEESNDE